MMHLSLVFILDHPKRLVLTSISAAVSVAALTYFFGLWLDFAFDLSAHQHAAIDAVIAGTLAGTAVHVLMVSARRRRRMVLREMSRIADLNHYVRNDLQVILGTELMKTEANRAVVASCERIAETIERLFPMVGIERRHHKRQVA
jgi:hypothetical protein